MFKQIAIATSLLVYVNFAIAQSMEDILRSGFNDVNGVYEMSYERTRVWEPMAHIGLMSYEYEEPHIMPLNGTMTAVDIGTRYNLANHPGSFGAELQYMSGD